MRGYEEYRESRVKWVGEIPAHWRTARGKNLYKKMNRPVSDTDEVITCFRNGEVTLRKNRRTTGFTESLKEIGYQGIKKGDLVIHMMDAFAGAIGVSDSDGKGTPVYNVCQARGESNNYYYAYLLREMARTGYIQSLYRGIRERSSDFRFDVFAKQYYPVPPKDEQDQIARFLDWKISAIDRLIFLRHRQFTDLEDLKKSAISRAVTRGLNPEVELRDSGVKWLGQIPSGWGVVRLKRVARINPPCDSYGLKPKDMVTFAPMECIRTDKRIPLDAPLSRYNSSYNVFNNGDIALAKVTPCFENDNVCIMENLTNGYAFGSSELFNVRPLNVWPKYLLYYFMTHFFKSGGIASMTGAIGLKRVSSKYLRNALLPLPPTAEQQQISTYLDKLCSLINHALTNLSNQIDTLRELKARLISDTVTGKIDVRQIPIPQQENP